MLSLSLYFEIVGGKNIEFPTFNYKTVYFFLMSLFGVIFVFSLMGLIEVQYPLAISITSLINVFFNILAWIYDNEYDKTYQLTKPVVGHPIEVTEEYQRKKFYNLVGVASCSFIFALIGILAQMIPWD